MGETKIKFPIKKSRWGDFLVEKGHFWVKKSLLAHFRAKQVIFTHFVTVSQNFSVRAKEQRLRRYKRVRRQSLQGKLGLQELARWIFLRVPKRARKTSPRQRHKHHLR